MSEEEKKAIEFLKGVCTDDCASRPYIVEPILNLIKKQSKEIEELKEKTKKCEYYEMVADELSKEIEELKKPKYIMNFETNEITTLTNDFISKDKIKVKIEELEKEEKVQLKGTKGQDRYSIKQEYMYKRSGLHSLLEEK